MAPPFVTHLYLDAEWAFHCDLIRTMLESRRFFVVLNGKKSRWRRQKNGLPQGSVLAPMLFNIYTNDQPVHTDTQSFIYADDLCIASQEKDFNNIEVNLTSALSILSTYYDLNQLRANPSKTQVCAFHLRNRDAKRDLNLVWNGTRLNNTSTPCKCTSAFISIELSPLRHTYKKPR